MNKLGTKTDCPVCGKKRLLQMGNIVSSEEGSLVIYNKCPHCVSSFIAVVSGSRERGLMFVLHSAEPRVIQTLMKDNNIGDILIHSYNNRYICMSSECTL